MWRRELPTYLQLSWLVIHLCHPTVLEVQIDESLWNYPEYIYQKRKRKRSSSDVMEGVVVTRFLLGHWQALVWIA
jgi:hypothetical protein